MYHLQSPKGEFASRKTCAKASNTWILIEKIGTRITFSKKFGLEITTSVPGVLLDGLALRRKPSTCCIVSRNEAGYLVFTHDGALYSFDLKHKEHIATVTGFIAIHNKALYGRICDTFERTSQVFRMSRHIPSFQESQAKTT